MSEQQLQPEELSEQEDKTEVGLDTNKPIGEVTLEET